MRGEFGLPLTYWFGYLGGFFVMVFAILVREQYARITRGGYELTSTGDEYDLLGILYGAWLLLSSWAVIKAAWNHGDFSGCVGVMAIISVFLWPFFLMLMAYIGPYA